MIGPVGSGTKPVRLIDLPVELLLGIDQELKGNTAQLKLRSTCRFLYEIGKKNDGHDSRNKRVSSCDRAFPKTAFKVKFSNSQFNRELNNLSSSKINHNMQAKIHGFVCKFSKNFSLLNDINRVILINYGSNLKNLMKRSVFIIDLLRVKEDLRQENLDLLWDRSRPCREMDKAIRKAGDALNGLSARADGSRAGKVDFSKDARFGQQLQRLQRMPKQPDESGYQTHLKNFVSSFIEDMTSLTDQFRYDLVCHVAQTKNLGHFSSFVCRMAKTMPCLTGLEWHILAIRMDIPGKMQDVFQQADAALHDARTYRQRLPA